LLLKSCAMSCLAKGNLDFDHFSSEKLASFFKIIVWLFYALIGAF
jgi:hypothetical protein